MQIDSCTILQFLLKDGELYEGEGSGGVRRRIKAPG